MQVEKLKEMAEKAIDANKDKILAFAESVAKEPELGFKEFKTAKKFASLLQEQGFLPKTQIARTGVVAAKKGRQSKMRVALLGELDAITVPSHPFCDTSTGAVHACGHNHQIASIAAASFALNQSGIMDFLDGDIVLMGVPAEEYVEVAFRKKLRDEGQIWFLGGKQEFIRLGEFDKIDISIMQHTVPKNADYEAGATSDCNGFSVKTIQYVGKASHAGAAPFEGVNALNAAMLGLLAIHAQRETFKDEDKIRVHPIITKGGDLVNVVPDDVRIETYVRGVSIKAIEDAAKKVDRALRSGADAVGAKCIIENLPGYIPLMQCENLNDIMFENLKSLFGQKATRNCAGFGGGSTDFGDLSQIMPCIQSYFVGAEGGLHSENYRAINPDCAILGAAKAMVFTAIDLLADGAKKGMAIKNDFVPTMTKEEYLRNWGGIDKE